MFFPHPYLTSKGQVDETYVCLATSGRIGTRLVAPVCAGHLRVCGVSSIRHITELRCWADLAAIHSVLKARLPELPVPKIGLAEIAELCKRELKARPTRDYHDTREQILRIAVEWDLDHDALEQQSNECLRAVASFL